MLRRSSLFALLMMLWCQSAFAQMDIMGVWRPLPRNQDGSGMTGDIAGVPVSDAARWRVAELVAGRLRRHRVGLPSARVGLLARGSAVGAPPLGGDRSGDAESRSRTTAT